MKKTMLALLLLGSTLTLAAQEETKYFLPKNKISKKFLSS